jgi:hypothetical protein
MNLRGYAWAPLLISAATLMSGNALAASPRAVRSFAATPPATVLVHGASLGPAVSNTLLGVNMAAWTDITETGLGPPLHTAGITAVRWPGGSESDAYHWQTNTSCGGGYTNANSTFDNFMTDIAKPQNLSVSITLNYGSNAACNGGGDPAEAAAWVAHAKAQSDGVRYWTVGNEEYGSWEEDLHAKPHDPATYAAAVATGYYPQIKAADPSALVGVVVDGSAGWDQTVIAQAKFDFVELHFYAQAPGAENDAWLMVNGPDALTALISQLRHELIAAGKGSVPIYLGELGSVYTNPGKQAQSITQALFAGQVLGELEHWNVFRATWWIGYGGCGDASSGNFSSLLYGWQNFGGYMIFSDGTPEYGCPNATPVPLGTLLPTARAYQVMSYFIRNGERDAAVTLGGSDRGLRVFAVSRGTSYAVALFNRNKTESLTTAITVDKLAAGSSVQTVTYGKAQYDLSKNNVWAGPVTSTSGAWKGSVNVTLPPWSMSVVTLNP